MKEGQLLALQVLRDVMEEKLNSKNIQLAQIVVGEKFKILTQEEVEPLVEQLEPPPGASTTTETTASTAQSSVPGTTIVSGSEQSGA